jgi:hypothetical protein
MKENLEEKMDTINSIEGVQWREREHGLVNK